MRPDEKPRDSTVCLLLRSARFKFLETSHPKIFSHNASAAVELTGLLGNKVPSRVHVGVKRLPDVPQHEDMKTFWRHVQPPHAWTVINKDIFMETRPEILLSWDVTSTQEETSANLNIIIVDVTQTSFNTRWWSAAGKTTLNIKNDIYWEFWIL